MFYTRNHPDPDLTPFRLSSKPPLGLNYFLKTLGFSFKKLSNPEDGDPLHPGIKEKILSLESEFDMVLLMELFPESLILLSESLCWPIHRITSVPQKVRVAGSKVIEGNLILCIDS